MIKEYESVMALDVPSVARLLDISPQLVRKEIREGHLPSVRVGDKLIRVPRLALEQYLAAGAK
jgi:excisionase family DNA binding protein